MTLTNDERLEVAHRFKVILAFCRDFAKEVHEMLSERVSEWQELEKDLENQISNTKS